MSCTTRVLLVALLAGACFFLPSKGYSLERDPYLYKSLIGKIQFEYEKVSATENNRTSTEASRFKQTYSLDTRGNLLSRYLIIYDAGVAYSRANISGTSSPSYNTSDYNLYLKTTFLPKSLIPLTLYGSYDEQDVYGLPNANWRKRTIYGLNWFSSIKPFPKTGITVERANEKTPVTDVLSTFFKINSSKDIGPSENEVEYSYRLNDDQKSAGFSSSSNALFRNLTHLSRNTSMYIGATRSRSKNRVVNPSTTNQDIDIVLQGLSMALTSKPSEEFSQSHAYSFFENKTNNGKSQGSSYSGDLDYRFSDRLKSSLSLNFTESKDDTPTSSSRTRNVSTADSITYNITRKLTISELVSYSKTNTNATGQSVLASVGDRSLLRVITTLAYTDRYDWGNLNTSYGLGYIADGTTKNATGKGIEQQAFFGLGDLKFNPYVGFNTFTRYDSIKKLSGDISGKTVEYGIEAFNRPFRKYVIATASYEKSSKSSWINILESRTETYRLKAESDYFRNTRLRATAEHNNRFNAITGFTNETIEEASVIHSRQLFGGYLNATVAFSHLSVSSSGIPQEVNTRLYQLKYSRYLMRTLLWQALAERSERTDRATFVNVTSIENGLFMPFRSWLFSLEHRYSLTNESIRELRENRILLKASRTFFRAF